VFPSGYPLTIIRDGQRLLSRVPEHSDAELFAETETQFFIKGNPARWIFHRDNAGHVDSVINQWKRTEQKAERRAVMPANPEGTNGLIGATTGGRAVEAGLE